MSVQDIGPTDIVINEIKSILDTPLEKELFTSQAGAATSDFVETARYKGLTFIVEASEVTTGADIEVLGSKDGVAGIGLASYEDDGSTGTVTQSISADGTYVYTIPDSITMKYMAVDIPSLTDGTYTVTLLGKPV